MTKLNLPYSMKTMKALTSVDITAELTRNNIDYFISSASFEDRCLGLASLLADFNFEKVLIFGTIDFDKKIEENRSIIVSLFKNSAEVLPVDLTINNPVLSFVSMIKACEKLFEGAAKTLLFDITTFTHESLLMLFRLLLVRKRPEDKILISYVGAKNYSCNVPNNDEKWLTKGVKELRSIIGYPGYSDPSKKNHLIILFGFEKERTMKLIEEFDFEMVSLAFGSKGDSIGLNNQEINENRHNEILKLYSNAKKFDVSLTDPHLVKRTILDYVSQYNDYNIVIAPMNNKISTIGVGLAAIENKDIQLFYMQANIYNIEAYSEIGDEYFLAMV